MNYKNHAIECMYCGSEDLSHSLIEDSVSGMVQLEFECSACGSTWDVVYEAVMVINEYNTNKKSGGNEKF